MRDFVINVLALLGVYFLVKFILDRRDRSHLDGKESTALQQFESMIGKKPNTTDKSPAHPDATIIPTSDITNGQDRKTEEEVIRLVGIYGQISGGKVKVCNCNGNACSCLHKNKQLKMVQKQIHLRLKNMGCLAADASENCTKLVQEVVTEMKKIDQMRLMDQSNRARVTAMM